MKYHLLAGAAAMALVVGGSAVVRAADLPMAPAVPMIAAAPAVYDWTGFYAGLNLGYGFGEFSKSAGHKGFNNRSIDGIVGGAQIGGNWQFESFVLGVEADAQGTGFGDSKGKWKTEGGIFGTVRGRAGFAFDRFLVYGTGGFAYSDVNVSANKKNNNNNWRTGWTAGGGIEASVTDNVSIKLEYLYADLGEGDWFKHKNGNKWKADYTQSLVRAGVNYKF